MKYDKYNYKPVGIMPTGNYGGLVVLAINYGIDDSLTTGFDFGDGLQGVRTTPIHTDINGRDYIIRYQRAYYLDDIQRV